MEFGISLRFDSIRVMIECALTAETCGFNQVWIPDTQIIGWEVYSLLSLISIKTSRIRLGPGVTNPLTRSASATSTAIITLNELSGGRAVLGLGAGDWSAKIDGNKPAPLKVISKYIDDVRYFCSSFPPNSVLEKFNGMKKTIPIYLAASGQKMIELAGSKADGVIINVGLAPELLDKGLRHLANGAQQSGRDFDKIRKICFFYSFVSEDRNEAIKLSKPVVAFLAAFRPDILKAVGVIDSDIEELLRINEAFGGDIYHYGNWAEAVKAVDFLNDEYPEKIFAVGRPEDVITKIKGLEKYGFDEVYVRPVVTYGYKGFMLDFISLFGNAIIPSFK